MEWNGKEKQMSVDEVVFHVHKLNWIERARAAHSLHGVKMCIRCVQLPFCICSTGPRGRRAPLVKMIFSDHIPMWLSVCSMFAFVYVFVMVRCSWSKDRARTRAIWSFMTFECRLQRQACATWAFDELPALGERAIERIWSVAATATRNIKEKTKW